MRHAQDIDTQGHDLTIMVPDKYLNNRKDFTPWLSSASSLRPALNNTVAAVFQTASQQVHATTGQSHFTTVDVRVAGQSVRALLDSGATCSCMSADFAKKVGALVAPAHKSLGGIGGSVKTLGTCKTDVKIRKFHTEQTFQVLSKPIAGYDILLGEDFWHENHLGVQFGSDSVRFNIGTGPQRIEINQSLSKSKTVEIQRDPDTALPIRLKAVASPGTKSVRLTMDGNTPTVAVMSRSEQSKNSKKIRNKQQIAYRIFLTTETPTPASEHVVPDSIQTIIDKHSTPGGTLCGTIPDNTHAKGFDCKIDLKEGAQPVYIRQYRLTPLEKTELLRQVDDFIKKGWIEKSTSSWSFSVLFIPKPNGKLRFCVDFRKVNDVTQPNRSPLANQSELLDSLQGNSYFSALDLASGYYQLSMNEKSRPYTAFPTPYGLMQWRVMPMGLSNAPAVFQQAMNQVLREQIRNGYCLVYLDDIIIMSRSLSDHEKHLDAVLTQLHKHNLFCQLPKCFWAQPQIKYLGHLVDGNGVYPDPTKVETLDKWKPPTKEPLFLTDC